LSAFARSYAQAFLQAAPAGLDVDGFFERAEAIRRAIGAEPRLKAFFTAPAVPADAKTRALGDLGRRAGLDDYGRRFLELILRNRRLLDLGVILSALRGEADRARGVVEAQVTVATSIGEPERQKIAEALARASGRVVRLTTSVDEEILGGFIARVGSEVFDASVRRAIERFEEQAREGTGD